MARTPRWATFDCYGTLVDWNGGIRAELSRLFSAERAPARFYHAIEPGIQRDRPDASYREVMASIRSIGVPFDGTVVASEIGSYKPAHRHWQVFYEITGADRSRHVHVAQSHFHDIVPAAELGIPSVWINRLGERVSPPPTVELETLDGLAAALDGIVAPG